jgi:uncharacterized damage-inducible protein DinB
MSNQNLGQGLLQELEMEATATRKCLEKIPESSYEWKPHDKSMQMGRLTLIVAEIPKWIAHMVNNSDLDFATFEHFRAQTTAEMVAHFDENMELARKALSDVTDEDINKPFSLKNNGQVIMTLPKIANIAPSINHLVHHRGQLTVYMRLNNLPVPSIYGPSADEQGF